MASKKNKKTASRKEKKIIEVEEKLHLERPDVLNHEDKENIRRQCEKLDHAKMLSAVNSFMSKYCIYYRGYWYFAVYNRDKNRLVDTFDISFLTQEEKNVFNLYKSRVENEIRKNTVTPIPEVRPVVMVHQPEPPAGRPEEGPDEE